MTAIKKRISHNIKKRNWTIAHLSQISGVPVPTLKGIIYGNCKSHHHKTLNKIAQAFNCEVSDLINEEHEPVNDNLLRNKQSKATNTRLIWESIDRLNDYCKRHDMILDRNQSVKVVETMASLITKQKETSSDYIIDDTTIEWIIEQNTAL